MLERIAELEARFEELTRLLSDPEVTSDHRRTAELARERYARHIILATFSIRREGLRD